MKSTVDDILEEIGSFGRYQFFFLCIYGYAKITVSTFPILIVTFITAEPEWVCVEEYSSLCNFTEPISLTSKHYNARCSMPREAWTYVSDFTSTVTEYDLVCDKSYLQSITQSCSWVGMLLGLLVGGMMADCLGRRLTFISGCVGVVIATWIMVFPKHFNVFIAGRTFIGLFSGVMGGTGFVLLTESTGKKHRALIGIGSFYFWVAGCPILAILAYLLPNWRHLLLATAAFSTPCLFLCWLTPESIHWLLLNGESGKAQKQLAKIAKINKKTFPDVELEEPEYEQKGNICTLFSLKESKKRVLVSWNIWFTVALVYYGVTYGSVDLGWNRYLTFALTSLIEFPSNVASIVWGNKYGRKKCVCFGLVFSCIASIIAVSLPVEESREANVSTVFRIIIAIIAKFFINLSFSVVYVWTVELFPTITRGIALSSCSACARLGSFAASYVIWLIRIHQMLPFGIMGFFCLQSAVFTLFLPETNGQPTMETMSDMVKKNDALLPSVEETTVNDNKANLGELLLSKSEFWNTQPSI